MTREEFLRKDEELIKKREALKAEFVRTNSPLKPGTKVKVTHINTVEYGFIEGYKFQCDRVVPVIKKMKKDGTPSKLDMFVWWSAKVEKC